MTYPQGTPIQVEVTNHPQPKKYLKRSTYHTAVLPDTGTGLPFVEIAGYDPLRETILIFNAGQAYVVCNSQSQAADSNNTGTTITTPNGMYVKSGAQQFEIPGNDPVWLAYGGATPCLIGYLIVRKVAD